MDDDLIPLSALQHYLYCPRQCALIHVERLWAENQHTAEGRVLHERTDQPRSEKRRGVRSVSAMPLSEPSLGITGVADMVEFHATEDGERPHPVEYKRGRAKAHRADEVQLCAQALCLEAMLGKHIDEGALYYGKTRRRVIVTFDESLRALTFQVIAATRELFRSGRTPTASYESGRCDQCSLIDLCQPRLLGKRSAVSAWLARQLEE